MKFSKISNTDIKYIRNKIFNTIPSKWLDSVSSSIYIYIVRFLTSCARTLYILYIILSKMGIQLNLYHMLNVIVVFWLMLLFSLSNYAVTWISYKLLQMFNSTIKTSIGDAKATSNNPIMPINTSNPELISTHVHERDEEFSDPTKASTDVLAPNSTNIIII